MRFKWVEIQNFLSYGEKQRLDLEDRGLVAVLGFNRDAYGASSNGAGKSSCLEAVVWALYGETLRKYKGDDVINRTVGKNCVVSLAVEDQGVEYVIRRSRKVAGKNRLVLVRDGKELEKGTKTHTQDLISSLVGMSFQTFCQSVMMWHGNKSFSEMTDSEAKSVLEDILQVEQLRKANKLVGVKIRDKQNSLVQKEAALESLVTRVEDLNALIANYHARQKEHATLQERKRQKILREKAEVEARIEQLYSTTGLDKLLKIRDDLRDERKDLEARIRSVQAKRAEIFTQYAKKREKVARTEGAAHTQLQHIQARISAISEVAGYPCPTCDQVLSPDDAQAFLDGYQAEADKLQQHTLVNTGKARAKVDKDEARALDEVRKEENTLDAAKQELDGRLIILEEKISKREAELSLIRELEGTVTSLQEEAKEISREKNPFTSLIADSEERKKLLVRSVKFMEYGCKAIRLELDHLVYWQHAFSNKGIKSYLFDNVVPFLTERAQDCLDILTEGDIRIEFHTQSQNKDGSWREKFQVKAVNQHGADVYHGNSDGEKSRIDLAVGWALADLAASRAQKPIRFRGLDEPFVHVDPTGQDMIIKLLNHVLPTYETVLCVTHSTHLRDQFPNEVQIIYENGFSRIVG